MWQVEMSYTPPTIMIVMYVVSTLITLSFSPVFVQTYYRKLPDKYHDRQLHLRRGSFILALIVLNLLSPLTVGLYFAVGILWCVFFSLYITLSQLSTKLAKYLKRRWQSSKANSKIRSKNKCKQSSGGAEILLPSSIIQDVLLHNQQDMSKFPYISSVSELEDDDGDSCPICLRSIYPPNINRKCNIIEITHDVALDNEPCVTTCNHVMHYKCLREWLSLQQTCPICGSMQLMNRCKVFRCRYATVKTIIRGDVNTNTINSHNGSFNSDMALPTISSGVPYMSTIMAGIHVRREATSGECYRELSVSVDLHDPTVNDVCGQERQTRQNSDEIAREWPSYDQRGIAMLF